MLVNEIFQSIQGEATFAGTPSTFVRLQGCDVGCPWCDTKYTWKTDGPRVTIDEVIRKTTDNPTSAAFTAAQVVGQIAAAVPRHVVITGGEPANYDLTELSQRLVDGGYGVQLETSGTAEIRIADDAWVTCSPKIGMPGGFKVRRDAVARADEIKMPVGKRADVDKLIDFLRDYGVSKKIPVWLQPLSQNKKASDICYQAAAIHGWRVSVQIHKYLGLR